MKTSTSASILLGLCGLTLLTAMPVQLGLRDGVHQKFNTELDAELDALGLQSSAAYSDTDLVAGAAMRWSFPSLAAAQLPVGEPLTFVLPGGSTLDIPLVERVVMDSESIQFTFANPLTGDAAEITVRHGLVRGLLHTTIKGARVEWSLATGTDDHGLTGEYYSPPHGVDGAHESIGSSANDDAGHGDGGIAGACQDSGQLIDVLLVYTPSFAAQFGGDAVLIQAALSGDIGYANSALANSNAVPRFRIAGFAQLTNNSTGSLTNDLIALIDPLDGWNDQVGVLRNNTAADLVALYSDAATFGSVAVIGVNTPDGSDAFSAIGRSASPDPSVSLARGLGANLGCCAQADLVPPCDGFYSYSQAWTYFVGSQLYQTVMASGSGSVVPVYSNPLVSWLGAPAGTPTANNARTASLTAGIVANYRCSNLDITDCDGDGVEDAVAIINGLVPDCNATGIPDSCDIALGISLDINLDTIPDECPLNDIEFSASGVTSLDTLGSAVGMSSAAGDPVALAVIGAPGIDLGASNAGGAYLFTVQAGAVVPIAFLQAGDRLTNAFFGRGATVYKRAASAANPVIAARNFALVGAYRWTETAAVGTFPSKGTVYLFAQSGAIWTQLWRYAPPPTNTYQARENALFGYSVAMGRNPREGNDQIIVGAPGHTGGRGKVYFLRNYIPSGQTVEKGGLLSMRAPSVPVDGDNYGAAVALEPFLPVANTSRVLAVIGAPGRNVGKGAAYVFDRGPGSANGIGAFPPTGITLNPPGVNALSEGDRYGSAVAVSGNLLAIGAPGESAGQGIVHFWERSTNTIAAIPSTYTYRGNFRAPDAVDGDAFGSSISIAPAVTGGGFTVVVGAPKADIPTPGGLRNSAGKVYVLHKTVGASGADLLSTRAMFNPATGDEFGYSAASSTGFSLIGAPFSDITGLNSGKARLLTVP